MVDAHDGHENDVDDDNAHEHDFDEHGAAIEHDAAMGKPLEDRTSRASARELRRSQRKRARRRHRTVIAILILVLLLPVFVVGGWVWFQIDPLGSPGSRVSVVVQEGWSVSEIGDELQARGVVGSSLVFRLYARATKAGPFRAGRFDLRRDIGARAAVTALEKKPKLVFRKLALPPGLTLEMIAARVGELPGLSAERFLEVASGNLVRSAFQPGSVSSLEGLTWPDTYFVDPAQDERSILAMIVARFDDQLQKLGVSSLTPPAGVSAYEALVAASLIQTEAKVQEDRPLIAAVIYNRIRAGMLLQIDATVLYARGSREGAITKSDLALDSPYNTYATKGLPPTPIATLSSASIMAAFQPDDVPYLFYVLADANGKHAFGVTAEDHERNVAAARAKGLLE